MSVFFDESYYLKSKLAQLKSKGEKDADGNDYTLTTLQKAIVDAGLTPETHYQLHGRTEKLNPNAYFNESEYLHAKLNQLKSVGEKDANGNDFTLETLTQAIEGLGLTVAEHYETFGSHETDAKGNLINPSNAFDANAYVAAKLYQLQTTGTEEEKALWANKTGADVVAAIVENGMSPVSHYESFGAKEANVGTVPLVQTVPVTVRVENDPARAEVTGELVPSNYNTPTPPPAEVTADKAAPVTKPADVGGLTNATVSPTVTTPTEPVPVPGDADYVAPPANIVDTNDKPVVVVPPATEGGKPQFGVVGDNGTISGVDSTGKPTDTVIGKVDDAGTITPVDPTPPPADPTPNPDPTPSNFAVTTNESGVVSFTGGDGSITFTLASDGTATFKSGTATHTVSEFDNKSINLSASQTLKADAETLGTHTVKGGTVEVSVSQAVPNQDETLSSLSLPNISSQLKLVAKAASGEAGVMINGVNWAGESGGPYTNSAGFKDGKVVSVTGSTANDLVSLDLADIGSLKFNADNTSATFTKNNTLALNGGDGDQDTLALTYFNTDNNQTRTLGELNEENLFDALSGFETLVLNKANASNNMKIDASTLDDHDVKQLVLMTSADVTKVDSKDLNITMTEETLLSGSYLDINLDSAGDVPLNVTVGSMGLGSAKLTLADSATVTGTGAATVKVTGKSTVDLTGASRVTKVDLSDDDVQTVKMDAQVFSNMKDNIAFGIEDKIYLTSDLSSGTIDISNLKGTSTNTLAVQSERYDSEHPSLDMRSATLTDKLIVNLADINDAGNKQDFSSDFKSDHHILVKDIASITGGSLDITNMTFNADTIEFKETTQECFSNAVRSIQITEGAIHGNGHFLTVSFNLNDDNAYELVLTNLADQKFYNDVTATDWKGDPVTVSDNEQVASFITQLVGVQVFQFASEELGA